MRNNRLWQIACLFGASAVLLGAFGAHMLKPKIGAYEMEIFKTGVLYHFIHAVMMVVSAWVFQQSGARMAKWAFLSFGIGIVCFSGSLYGLAIRNIAVVPESLLGPITPIGGLLFILGWVFLFTVKHANDGEKI